MFVLGVDPGLSRCGYCVCESAGHGKVKIVSMGVITTDKDLPTPDRLQCLKKDFVSLLVDFKPNAVAIERVFFYKNLKTALGVVQASGVLLAESVDSGCLVAEYSPTEIKLAITGDGKADKAQIQFMVKNLLRLNEVPKPADAADAAALALCYLAYNPYEVKKSRLGLETMNRSSV